MATYEYEARFIICDMGEIEAESESEARELIEEAWVAMSDASGYTMPWDEISIDSLVLMDGEDD